MTPRVLISPDRTQVMTGDGHYLILEKAPREMLSLPEGHYLVIDPKETKDVFDHIHPLPGDTHGSVVRFTINIEQMINLLRKMHMSPFATLEVRHMKYRGHDFEQDCLVLFGRDQVGILSTIDRKSIGHGFYNPFDEVDENA